jgi:acetyltransferase-like isoleucine patch superfamily enzyme
MTAVDDGSGGTAEYSETRYLQFSAGRPFRWVMAALGVLSWPMTIPMALVSRLSDIVFRTFSELLALLPYFPGVIVRYEFYRFALRRCGRNVLVETGAVFIYRDIRIGNHVLIGRQCIVHDCDIGDYVLIGERCTILSGSRQHRHERLDVPMALQGGQKRRVHIGSDCWLGSHSVVMADVGSGAIVAAGAAVTRPVAPRSIVGGVPAKVLGERGEGGDARPAASTRTDP